MYENWMGEIWESIKGKYLYELMIPGTHDSGACNLANAFFGVPIAADLANTQNTTFTEQLNAGIRSFDLRFMSFESDASDHKISNLIVHCDQENSLDAIVFLGVSAEACFKEFDDFLTSHKKEMVVATIRTYRFSDDPDSWPAFQKSLTTHLKSHAVNPGDENTCTIEELFNKGRNLILKWSSDPRSQVSFVGPAFEDSNSYWPGTIPPDRKDDLKSQVDNYLNQVCLSTDRFKLYTVALPFAYSYPDILWHSIKNIAHDTNPTLFSWVQNEWARKINIFSVDFFQDGGDIVGFAAELNKLPTDPSRVKMPLDNVVMAMDGKPSTCNWDVVVSYEEAAINDLLRKKHADGSALKSIRIKQSLNDPNGDLECELKLQAPCLQFVAADSRGTDRARLAMPVQSLLAEWTSGGATSHLAVDAGCLQLTCDVPLASISGDTQEVKDGKAPIVFDAQKPTSNMVFLHFKNDSTTFSLDCVRPWNDRSDPDNNIVQAILKGVAAYCRENVSEIDYALGGISNQAKAGVKSILPKSFIFSVSKPDASTLGSLNLYIQAQDSGNPPGDSNPSFRPGGAQMSPVPRGYTAAVVISHDYLGKLLTSLLPGHSQGVDPDSAGLKVHFAKNGSVTYGGYWNGAWDNCEEINLNYSNALFYLNARDKELRVTMQSPQASGRFVKYYLINHEQQGCQGYLTIQFKVDHALPLNLAGDGSIQFSFNLDQSNIMVDVSRSRNGWAGDLNDVIAGIKSQVQRDIGPINVTVNEISTFVVDSLLLPGTNVVVFKKNDAFYVPHDLIVFGNISSNAD